MKAFCITRYLRRFCPAIVLVTLAGALGVYGYAASRQTYTASTVIRYANSGASSGYAPNGEPIDVGEIYGAQVISGVIEALGLSDKPDALRSRCYAEAVISDEQSSINQVLLARGEATDFFADTYTVCFVADGARGEGYARDVLDAILSGYCDLYSERYVEQRLLPNGAADLSGYDAIESVAVLEEATEEMLGYLGQKRQSYPDFRAASTGYAFRDLYDLYRYFYDDDIPRLYAMILSGAQSRDVEVLVSRLTSEAEGYQLSIDSREAQLESLSALIDGFAARNKDMMDYHGQTGTEQAENILRDVEIRETALGQETTYDALLREYVTLKTRSEYDRIAMEHDRYLLSVFAGRERAGDAPDGDEIGQAIAAYAEKLNGWYAVVDATSRELNSVLGAQNLQMLSTVQVTPSVNVRLMVLLAVVFFGLLSCGGAVVIGRGTEIMDALDGEAACGNRAPGGRP